MRRAAGSVGWGARRTEDRLGGKNLAPVGPGDSIGALAGPLIRIISDLHYGDERSRLRELAALKPMLEGVDTLVLNGDCCHTQEGAVPEQIAALKEFFSHGAPQVIWLTGNHDPDISSHHELLLKDGRVWVTHGDVFFDSVAPWCHLRAELVRRLEQKSGGDIQPQSGGGCRADSR